MVEIPNNGKIKPHENSSDGDGQHSEPPPIVLIADDDEDSRLMLKTLLEIWKYRVIEAKNGIEAINIAEQTRPDLILIDVKMPDLNGFNVTYHLRQSVKTESIPIIFLSGCAEATYKQQASAVGGNEYLTKPLDFQELEFTLGKYIRPTPEISNSTLTNRS